MVFSSLSFLFVFLPLVLIAHALAPRGARNGVLLAASCLFYAWGEPRYLAIMLATIAVDYVGGLAVEQLTAGPCRRVMTTGVVLINLAILFYFKYFNFVVENLNAWTGSSIDFVRVALPIGISFYTFQALSYVIDVSRGEVAAQRNPFRLALYITLFPQLIAGPIVRYRDIRDALADREVSLDRLIEGLRRFTIGLAKKVLIANTMGAIADRVFSLPSGMMPVSAAWMGAIAYSFQLYYDFSGYSDMAIGLGRMLGFDFAENFDHPYVSRSITEFWRRWHISLSSWFREYLYIPLGGNRVSAIRTLLNLSIVFLATGIWHGAAWTFVAWGAWHGAFILLERVTGWHKNDLTGRGRFVHHVYALLVVVFGWVLFRAESFSQAADFFRTMLGLMPAPEAIPEELFFFTPLDVVMGIAALVCATPVGSGLLKVADTRGWRGALSHAYLALLFYLSVVQITASTYNPFIYFRF